jgi:hypothetical protein
MNGRGGIEGKCADCCRRQRAFTCRWKTTRSPAWKTSAETRIAMSQTDVLRVRLQLSNIEWRVGPGARMLTAPQTQSLTRLGVFVVSNSTTRDQFEPSGNGFRSYITRRREVNLTVGASVALSYVIHIRDGRTEATSPSIQAHGWIPIPHSVNHFHPFLVCMHQ